MDGPFLFLFVDSDAQGAICYCKGFLLRMPRFKLDLDVTQVVGRNALLAHDTIGLAPKCFHDHLVLASQIILTHVRQTLVGRRVTRPKAELVASAHLVLEQALIVCQVLLETVNMDLFPFL